MLLKFNIPCSGRISYFDILLRWNITALSISCRIDSARIAQSYDDVLYSITDKNCSSLLGDLEIHELRGSSTRHLGGLMLIEDQMDYMSVCCTPEIDRRGSA